MNIEPDPTLSERISKAGIDIYSAVMWSVAEERGAHLETAIAAAGYLAGTAILRSCGVNLSMISPGAPVFVDAVNETGPAVLQQIMDLVAGGQKTGAADLNAPPFHSIPQDHQPRQSYEELVLLMWPQFEAILAKHTIPLKSAPSTCAGPLARMILEGQSHLSPAVAKTIVVCTIVQASKTAPPAPLPNPPALNNRKDFLRILAHAIAQIDAFAAREPAYPVWQELLQQLRAMRQWTANCSDPKPDQLQRISIGLIAARELEPAQNAEMNDLVTRLHLLSHYWRNWKLGSGLPAPGKETRTTQKAARMILLAIGAVLLVWLVVVFTFRIKVTQGSPLGPSVRAGEYSATLIGTLEPYMPSLHHDPTTERFRVSLVLHPVEGGSADRTIELAKGFRVAELRFGARILGADDKNLWLFVNGIKAVNLRTEKLIDAADLRRANPTLKNLPGVDNSNSPLIGANVHRLDRVDNDLWSGEDASRRFTFGNRLRVTTPDYKHVFEIDPESLKAIPAR